jgi:sugar lactone lactonase YvrE
VSKLRLWVSGGYELAEGARWVEGRLIFVDILAGALYESARLGRVSLLARLDIPLGAVAPVASSANSWIAAAGAGIALLGPEGTLSWLGQPESCSPAPTRMNDGACDPHGRFWAGSMAYDGRPGCGSLYRVDADKSVTRMLTGMSVVNGPAFDADGARMYLADTPSGQIYRYGIDVASGDITARQVFAVIPPADGMPDGMTVDSDGRLWVALWGGSAIRCFNPDGSVHRTLTVPAAQPSSVWLGGADGDQLFVTTACQGISGPTPESGAIFSGQVAASALPTWQFQG